MICTAAKFWANGKASPFIKRRTAGIYAIRNLTDGKVYVGSAVSMYDRLYNHVWHLEAGTHRNPKLLNAWRKYTISAFSLEVLEVVECPNSLLEREQLWIEKFRAIASGYNLSPNAGSNLGRVFGPAARKAIAKAATKAMADPGIKARHKQATREAMSHPEVKKKCSDALKQRWQDPAARALLMSARHNPEIEKRTAIKQSETRRKIMSERPDLKNKCCEALRKGRENRWLDPAAKEAGLQLLRQAAKMRWLDPAAREAARKRCENGVLAKALKIHWLNPAAREAARERLNKRWQDPAARSLLLASRVRKADQL